MPGARALLFAHPVVHIAAAAAVATFGAAYRARLLDPLRLLRTRGLLSALRLLRTLRLLLGLRAASGLRALLTCAGALAIPLLAALALCPLTIRALTFCLAPLRLIPPGAFTLGLLAAG